MTLVLYHRIADAECAAVRWIIVERGLKPRIDFQNVLTDAAEVESKVRAASGNAAIASAGEES